MYMTPSTKMALVGVGSLVAGGILSYFLLASGIIPMPTSASAMAHHQRAVIVPGGNRNRNIL